MSNTLENFEKRCCDACFRPYIDLCSLQTRGWMKLVALWHNNPLVMSCILLQISRY